MRPHVVSLDATGQSLGKAGKKVTAKISIVVTDVAGNRRPVGFRVKLKL